MTDLTDLTDFYSVGEKNVVYPYDEKVGFYVPKDDMYIKEALDNGYLYAKNITMIIYAYCEKDNIIFDVGANFGCVTVPCAKKFYVHAFEPFDSTFNILKKNILENNLLHRTVLYNLSVGHINTLTKLSTQTSLQDFITKKINTREVTKPREYNGYIPKNERTNYGSIQLGNTGQTTKMITLDSLDFSKLTKLSLIKVDVEGAEPLVFYGAQKIIKKFRPIIIFEVNYQSVTNEMIQGLNLTDNIINFDIVKYCSELKYNRIIKMGMDFVILPKGRHRVLKDPRLRFKPIGPKHMDKLSNNPHIHKFKLYALKKIIWE